MARQLTGREKFWVVVLVAAAVGGGYYLLRGEGGLFGPQAAEEQEQFTLGEPPGLNMNLLAHNAAEYDPRGRDLFKYYSPPPPPPPPVERRPPPPPPPPRREVPIKPREKTVKEPAVPKPDFIYIGYIGHKDDPIAVFERGTDILQHQKGEKIDERFRLKEFGYRSVVLALEDPRYEGKTTELTMKQ